MGWNTTVSRERCNSCARSAHTLPITVDVGRTVGSMPGSMWRRVARSRSQSRRARSNKPQLAACVGSVATVPVNWPAMKSAMLNATAPGDLPSRRQVMQGGAAIARMQAAPRPLWPQFFQRRLRVLQRPDFARSEDSLITPCNQIRDWLKPIIDQQHAMHLPSDADSYDAIGASRLVATNAHQQLAPPAPRSGSGFCSSQSAGSPSTPASLATEHVARGASVSRRSASHRAYSCPGQSR